MPPFRYAESQYTHCIETVNMPVEHLDRLDTGKACEGKGALSGFKMVTGRCEDDEFGDRQMEYNCSSVQMAGEMIPAEEWAAGEASCTSHR